MTGLTGKRKAALNRGPDGRFKAWRGGQKKADIKKKNNTFQGIKVHIGKEFKRQHGRKAGIGSIVRTKKSDGSYHKQAYWYIKTVKGWRRTTQRKPSKAMIKRVKRGEMP